MATVAERMLRIFRGYERAHYFADFANAQRVGNKLVPEYGAVAGPITLPEIEQHLAGQRAVLAVPVDENGKSYFGKIDIDDYAVDVPALARRVKRRGHPMIVERSKSGGAHIAFYPKKPWESRQLRQQLIEWAADLGFSNVEIFPKQDRLDPTRDTGAGINLPYFGGNAAKNYAFSPEGEKLTLEQWLDAIETMPERLKPALGQANVEAAADYLAQFWTEGRRDILNIRVIGCLLRAKIDEAAVEQLIEKTRDIAGDLAEPRREVRTIAADLASDAKKVPGFTKLIDPAEGLMSREQALELLRLMGAQPPPDPVTIEFITLPTEWLTTPPEPLLHTIRPLFPEKTVSLLVAEGGAGKTTFALRTAFAVATGRELFGMESRKGKVVYVALEDQSAALRRRVFWIAARERERMMRDGASPAAIEAMETALRENLIIAAGAGHQLHLVTLLGGVVIQSPQLPALIEKLPEGIELLILDPMSRLNGAEENSNATGTAMVNAAERIVMERGCGVLIPHHTGKASAKEGDVSQYSARGASAFVDAARSVVRILAVNAQEAQEFSNCSPEVVVAGDLLKVHHAKCNEGRKAVPFFLRRNELDFELFTPEFNSAARRRDLILGELFAWFTERGRRPFSRREIESSDAVSAIFPQLHPSRHEVREAVTYGLAEGALIASNERRERGRPVELLTFRENFVPPDEEI